MEKPAKENENLPLDKAQKALKRAHDAQPMKAATGALAGAIAAETVSVGAFYIKLISEMSKNANRLGMSIVEAQHPHSAVDITNATLSNPRSIKALVPLIWTMAAAPFVGSTVGAWFAIKHGNSGIEKKHTSLDKMQEARWQDKIADQLKEKDAGAER